MDLLQLLSPFGIKASWSNKRIESLIRIEHGEFEVCRPIEREKRLPFGRSKRIFAHRTSLSEWDIRIV